MEAITDWDDAYANRKYVPDTDDIFARWEKDAAAFRESWGASTLDISYGPDPRQSMDLFHPLRPAKGLVVFVHGGYWMAFDKSSWSHLSRGALDRGWAVAVPSYRLTPEVGLAEIASDVAAAVNEAANIVPGPVRLSGHSAGGHLVCRLMCPGSALAGDVAGRVEAITSISGVHDLRPLLKTALNDTLGMTKESAAAESPVLMTPATGTIMTAWVGGDERPEFIRQSRLIVDDWNGKGAAANFVEDVGKNHFTVIDALSDANSALVRAVASVS